MSLILTRQAVESHRDTPLVGAMIDALLPESMTVLLQGRVV